MVVWPVVHTPHELTQGHKTHTKTTKGIFLMVASNQCCKVGNSYPFNVNRIAIMPINVKPRNPAIVQRDPVRAIKAVVLSCIA